MAQECTWRRPTVKVRTSAEIRGYERAADGAAREAREAEGGGVDRGRGARDEGGHHLAHGRRKLEAVARHASGHEEAFEVRLVEDGHPVGRDVEGAGPAARVAGLRHPWHGPARAPEG